MKENMIFNDDQYQLREFQVDRMKEVIVNNRISKENGVVFYGDSIVQGYDINKYIPEINDKYNCGIGGFTSETLLWICDEAVVKYKPSLVYISVGTNDLGNTNMRSPREIALNIEKLIRLVRGNLKEVKIMIASTTPCDENKQGPKTGKCLRTNFNISIVNKEIQNICNRYENVEFIDIYSTLLDKISGNIKEIYTTDGLHLTEKGYEKITDIIKPRILQLYND
ncbi:MAG: GDSL-type esterase/lipase family protein [Clostridium sp.]|uniref:SGNH/GDSL hydrolase family protein n=1 Tax=Clostridium sp. TaxID=1506 RepID=UPI00290F355E|nr:GDSL-type esterase/lipase family protein [Clostridium sp.]MDU4938797.1 GDSL-type esterase/lipase family protein [Clostridium sp.]